MLCPDMTERLSLLCLLIRSLILLIRVPHLLPNQLPKSPFPNTNTLGIQPSIYEYGNHKHSIYSTCLPRYCLFLQIPSPTNCHHQAYNNPVSPSSEFLTIPILYCFWLLYKNIIKQKAYKQQKFISYSSCSWEVQIMGLEDSVSGETPFLFIITSYGKRQGSFLGSLLQGH